MWEGGALCLVGVATDSGLPLFCRPPRPQLPFSLIGSLNGVHMFGAGAGVGLRGAEAPGLQLAWGGYGHSITLIALSSAPGTSGPALRRLLDSAFSAMVLVLGLDELVPVRNVERLKRDLRSCFGLIDSLLSPGGALGAGLGPPRCPLPPGPPRDSLQERLERFAGGAHTGLGCLFGGGRLVLATPQWWGLPPPDRALLGALLGGAPPGPTGRDLPVYLPHSSPTVPHRLLLLQLLPGVGVALLCGPRPPLQLVLTQLVPQFWGPVLEPLRGCARPPPAPLPPGVLAYLLIHRQQHWTQSGLGPGGAQAGLLPPQRYGAALSHLHALLTPQFCPEGDLGGPGPPGPALLYSGLRSHSGLLLVLPELLLLLLLPPRAPRGALRPLAMEVLAKLCPPGTH